jgi:hypothetical protein
MIDEAPPRVGGLLDTTAGDMTRKSCNTRFCSIVDMVEH